MIKNLIIPIDISPLSLQSIQYALLIKETLPTLNITLVGCNLDEDVINKKVKELREKHGSPFNEPELKVIIANGKYHEEIGVLANSLENPLILISAFRKTKNRDFITIQDVIKIVDAAKQHLIILPEKEFKFQIKRITYPIHLQTRVRHKATFTAQLANCFGSSVDIFLAQINLNEKKKKMCSLYCQQVSNHYKSIGIPLTINSAEGTNLAKVISDYSNNSEADLVSVIPEDKKDIRLFSVSYLEDLLSKIEIPALIIAGRKVKYSGSFSASAG